MFQAFQSPVITSRYSSHISCYAALLCLTFHLSAADCQPRSNRTPVLAPESVMKIHESVCEPSERRYYFYTFRPANAKRKNWGTGCSPISIRRLNRGMFRLSPVFPGLLSDYRIPQPFPKPAGGPPLTIFVCNVPTEGALSLRFCKGGRRCCVCYLILL